MASIQSGDTLVVAFLDRLSRNFEDGVRIQAELTQRAIAMVILQENIDTREGSAAAKFFRRSMLAQGAYQVDSASERIKLGLERARAGGLRVAKELHGLKNLFCFLVLHLLNGRPAGASCTLFFRGIRTSLLSG